MAKKRSPGKANATPDESPHKVYFIASPGTRTAVWGALRDDGFYVL